MTRHDIPDGLNLDTNSFTYEGIYDENEQDEKRVCEPWMNGSLVEGENETVEEYKK